QGRSADLRCVPVAAVRHGRRVYDAVLHPADRPHADRDPGAPRAQSCGGDRRMNLETFFAGKYAAYVWPAYGLSLVGLVGAVANTLRSYSQARARLIEIESSPAPAGASSRENASETAV